jgi:hypothetical protein
MPSMFEPIDPKAFLDPEDRLIWRQEPDNGGRALPGFAGQLRAQEDLSDSVYLAWYGQSEAQGLPKKILKQDYWPDLETAFKKNYSAELELALFEVWPSFESDAVQLTVDVLHVVKLRKDSTVIADQLTGYYIAHQSQIDLIMIRFCVASIFEQAQIDWLDEVELNNQALSSKLDELFFGWRTDDPKLHPIFEFLGEKKAEIGCKFVNYFFEGILKSSFAKASLEIEDDDDVQGGEDSDSSHPKKPKSEGAQP